MALTITATAGSASANSFVTEAEQIAYMAARLNSSTWTTVSGATCTETEKAAMIEATRDLNTRSWTGERVNTTQALAWPRQYATNPDDPYANYYATTVVPQRVKDACCELAFQFVNAGTTDIASLDPNIGVIEKTVDVLTTKYAEPYQRAQGLARWPRVMNYIRPLLDETAGVVRTVRG